MKRILVDSLDYGARIGIVEDGVLMELIYERKNSMPIIGNVYIGTARVREAGRYQLNPYPAVP